MHAPIVWSENKRASICAECGGVRSTQADATIIANLKRKTREGVRWNSFDNKIDAQIQRQLKNFDESPCIPQTV